MLSGIKTMISLETNLTEDVSIRNYKMYLNEIKT